MVALLLAACKGGSTDDADGSETDDPSALGCDDPGPDAPIVLKPEIVRWDFQGFPVLSFVPERPIGLIVYFHGGESAVEEVVAPEQIATLWNQMVDAGFGVVTTERSTLGGSVVWDYMAPDPSASDDVRRIIDLWDELVDTTALEADMPIVFTGFSDGSGMAASMGSWADDLGLPAMAVVMHNGSFGELPDVPTQLQVAEFDNPEVRSGLDRMVSSIRDKDVEVDQFVYEERLLTPESFLRVAEWDLVKAQEVFDELVEVGMIEATGERRVPDDRIDDAIDAWTRTTELGGAPMAASRMKVMWATHRYSAIEAVRECEFILGALP